MEAVRIICLLSESQLRGLVDRVSSLLSPRIDEISDIDELMLMDSVRVCVDFDIDARGDLKVLSAEVLDRDWDVLDADSFAFSQYLEPVIDDYNQRRAEAFRRHRQIRGERQAFQPC